MGDGRSGVGRKQIDGPSATSFRCVLVQRELEIGRRYET